MNVSFFFAIVQMQVQPYRRRPDNLLATVLNVSLTSFFVSSVLYRFHELTDDFDAVSAQLKSDWATRRFILSFVFISAVMIVSLFAGLLTMLLLHAIELFSSSSVDVFLWTLDNSQVIPPALEATQFHTCNATTIELEPLPVHCSRPCFASWRRQFCLTTGQLDKSAPQHESNSCCVLLPVW